MIQYMIVDDEPIAHRIIENYCDALPHLQKKGNCYNAFEAMQFLNEHTVDLLFLDINMPKLTGFEFLKTLANSPKIIVTTAYKEFALEGYELNISDYLLKPFSFERFMKAVNKVVTVTKPQSDLTETITTKNVSFFVKTDKQQHQIHSENLLFIEAYGHYTKIYLTDKMILSNHKISVLETLLPSNHFFRVHKSFIVAKDKIKYIEGNRIIIGTHKIPIGKTYKSKVSALLSS